MPKSYGPAHYGLVLVGFAFIALIGAEVVLVTTIPGTSYDGADGKAAQAEILATLEFARPFEITNLNPLQGLWPQMMPMNVFFPQGVGGRDFGNRGAHLLCGCLLPDGASL